MKKLVVSLIAIALVAAVVGSCFALYSVNATSKNVSISAGYQVVNMQIKNDSNSQVLSTVEFEAFNPYDEFKTQYVDVVLDITNGSLADGVHGKFTAKVTGELASCVDVTVNLLTAVGGSLSTNISAAATGDGYDIALSATPVAVRVTIALNAASLADFSLAAEKTGTLTLGWKKDTATVWTYSDSAYYIVGSLNGNDNWQVSPQNQNTQLSEGTGEIIATCTRSFVENDEIKVKIGDTWVGSFSASTADFTNSNEQIHFNNEGEYRIDVKHSAEQNRDYFEVTRIS